MIIKSAKDELVLIYNSDTQVGKSTYDNAMETDLKLKDIDLSKRQITPTQWLEIASALDKHISELIDKERDGYEHLFSEEHDYDEMGWVQLLEHHPKLLVNPIAMHGSKIRLIYSPSEILNI